MRKHLLPHQIIKPQHLSTCGLRNGVWQSALHLMIVFIWTLLFSDFSKLFSFLTLPIQMCHHQSAKSCLISPHATFLLMFTVASWGWCRNDRFVVVPRVFFSFHFCPFDVSFWCTFCIVLRTRLLWSYKRRLKLVSSFSLFVFWCRSISLNDIEYGVKRFVSMRVMAAVHWTFSGTCWF